MSKTYMYLIVYNEHKGEPCLKTLILHALNVAQGKEWQRIEQITIDI